MKSGLYVHIPFCKSKCRYCDFNSYAKLDEFINPYFSALIKETEYYKDTVQTVDTVYFGGGTPTSVAPELLGKTLNKLFEIYNISEDAEITAECNPGTIGFEGLKVLRQSGINRLSIGLQTTDDEKLKILGRIHSFDDFKNCYENARRAGFDNLSLDLMYGLPDQSLEDWDKTLDKALEFGTEHISCYSLKIEEDTPFAKMELNLPDDDVFADMYELAVKKLSKQGYNRYEISNFAKPGRESRHNLKYWRCDDFLGLGAGAYSCMGAKRFSNICKIDEYIEAIEQKGFAENMSSIQSADEQMSEFMFLGLRCCDGVKNSEFKARFGTSFTEIFGDVIKKYTDWGFLVFNGEDLKFSSKGFFVSNTILADFV